MMTRTRHARSIFGMCVAMLALAVAAPATALVTVSHSPAPDPMELAIGDTFDIDIHLTWDGAGALQGVFSSTQFDASVVEWVDADWPGFGDFAASIFDVFPPPVFIPGLSRLFNQPAPADPEGTLRTVSYGGTAPADPSAAGTVLITTLTFRVRAPGLPEIRGVFLSRDIGAIGDDFEFGPIPVPEPGVAVLTGLGLMALALRRTEGGR